MQAKKENIRNWYDNDWLKKIREKREMFPDCEDAINTSDFRNDFIRNHVYEPKRYLFCVYTREFLNILKIYLKKNHRDHIKYKKMWESSKYLEYYVHLIFKTGFYKNKVFITDKEIIEELEILISVLSKPLHAFSIFFNNKDEHNNSISDIDIIVKLILKRWINNETIKHPINYDLDGNKQEYLRKTLSLKVDEYIITTNLKFWRDKCLEEFDEKVSRSNKIKTKNHPI